MTKPFESMKSEALEALSSHTEVNTRAILKCNGNGEFIASALSLLVHAAYTTGFAAGAVTIFAGDEREPGQ